ncbi:MAG: hypothetical protein KatS3mg052_2697 [Candidatus Roseilinea sp.]|nr:MAG: hypothetical protein KatS3mg052_2697 [Candidatus Roseilinea sp.]
MQTRRRLGLVAAGTVLLAGVWGAMPARPVVAAWPPSSTLYGAVFRNNYFDTLCSVSVTNWSNFSTNVTLTPNGYSGQTQSIPAKQTRIWLSSIIPSGVETFVTAQSDNNALLTGSVRCRSTIATNDSLAVDEMIPFSGPATIPFISTGGGYFVGSPQSGNIYRISDGVWLQSVSGYSWFKSASDEAYVRSNAAQIVRGNMTTAGGGRGSLTALPDAYSGRTGGLSSSLPVQLR